MNIDRIRERGLWIAFGVAIAAIAFGVIGYYFEENGLIVESLLFRDIVGHDFLSLFDKFEHLFYKAFQFWDYGYEHDVYGPSTRNPFLWLGRWLALVAIVFVGVYVYVELKSESIRLKKCRKWKDHVIVCGYGDIGKLVVASAIKANKQVVVIDPAIDKDQFYNNKTKDCILIRQEAEIDEPLVKAGVLEAKYIIAVTGNDILNFGVLKSVKEIYLKSKDVTIQKFIFWKKPLLNRQDDLVAFAHVDNHELIKLVQDYPIFQKSENKFDGRIFCADETAARIIQDENPPDRYHPMFNINADPMHILVIGFNNFARSLVSMFIRSSIYINNKKTSISVIDSGKQEEFSSYQKRYKLISKVVNLVFRDLKPEEIEKSEIDAIINQQVELIKKDKIELANELGVSVIYLCLDDMLTQALTLEALRNIYNLKIPIVLCQSDKIPSPTWVKNKGSNIHIADPFTKACQYHFIINQDMETMAKKFHNEFNIREEIKHNDKNTEKGPAAIDWQDLPEAYKQSNRNLADHLGVKMRAINYDITDQKTDTDLNAVKDAILTNLEPLAIMEHRRWMADKYLAGWDYAEIRDELNRKNPAMVPWNALSDEEKEKDKNILKKDIFKFLDDNSIKVKPLINNQPGSPPMNHPYS